MTWKSGVAKRWEADARVARLEAGLNHHQLAWLREVLPDADGSHRLSAFEREFVNGMTDRLRQYGAETRISEAQWRILRSIEGKIYAAG